jgi:hypothetical protein
VDQIGGLLLDCSNDLRMAMPGRDDGDSRSEVKKGVSVNVFHHGSAARLCD